MSINIYFQEIEKRVFKNVPFFFIGYSFGAVIATEVARFLEKKNYIGKIVALDGSPLYVSKLSAQLAPGKTEAAFETSLLYNVTSKFAPANVLLNLEVNNFF